MANPYAHIVQYLIDRPVLQGVSYTLGAIGGLAVPYFAIQHYHGRSIAAPPADVLVDVADTIQVETERAPNHPTTDIFGHPNSVSVCLSGFTYNMSTPPSITAPSTTTPLLSAPLHGLSPLSWVSVLAILFSTVVLATIYALIKTLTDPVPVSVSYAEYRRLILLRFKGLALHAVRQARLQEQVRRHENERRRLILLRFKGLALQAVRQARLQEQVRHGENERRRLVQSMPFEFGHAQNSTQGFSFVAPVKPPVQSTPTPVTTAPPPPTPSSSTDATTAPKKNRHRKKGRGTVLKNNIKGLVKKLEKMNEQKEVGPWGEEDEKRMADCMQQMMEKNEELEQRRRAKDGEEEDDGGEVHE